MQKYYVNGILGWKFGRIYRILILVITSGTKRFAFVGTQCTIVFQRIYKAYRYMAVEY